MGINKRKPLTTVIRNLYSPGFSSIVVSFYNYNLSFGFSRYIGKNNAGMSEYEKSYLTTTVNYEGAALLYQIAMLIIYGKYSENEIKTVLQCNNNATLTFEYKYDQNNQFVAYLTINKNNESISFKFATHTYKVKEDGQIITKVMQSGLGVFAKIIDGYLTATGADRHSDKLPDLDKLTDDIGEFQGGNQQRFDTTGNNTAPSGDSW
jgi:hypothetical protein